MMYVSAVSYIMCLGWCQCCSGSSSSVYVWFGSCYLNEYVIKAPICKHTWLCKDQNKNQISDITDIFISRVQHNPTQALEQNNNRI